MPPPTAMRTGLMQIARFTTWKESSDTKPVEAGEVFDASQDNPVLDRLLTDFVSELSFHVVNLAICINPVRIAVGGGIVRSWERLRPGLEQALSAGVPFPPELVVAKFPSEAPLIGAVALALDAISPRDDRADEPGVDLSSVMLSEGMPT